MVSEICQELCVTCNYSPKVFAESLLLRTPRYHQLQIVKVMGSEKVTKKPEGLIGKLIGLLATKAHTDLYARVFKNSNPKEKIHILDIACGGGKFLNFLWNSGCGHQITGIESSPDKASLAKRINKEAIEQGAMQVLEVSLEQAPLKNGTVDMATAIETVLFLPNLDVTFIKVHQLLASGGSFIIINRFPKEGSSLWRLAKLKSETQYAELLKAAGFTEVSTDVSFQKDWIVVKATK